jgi:lysophospholipid acyltransferase (LPLAT)-like uncharacterized protein
MSRRTPILAFLGAGLIRLLGATWRIRIIDGHYEAAARRVAPTIIYAFWHGRMLALGYHYRSRAVHLLASEHRDGELMGRTMRFLGYGHVRGSSTRGGARAIRELAEKLEAGYDLGLSVDGPRGPRFVCKPGALEIAKLSGCAILPITCSAARHWATSSWDGFQVPKPFAPVWIRQGEPVVVPRNATPQILEEKRREAEAVLRDITEKNDDAATHA